MADDFIVNLLREASVEVERLISGLAGSDLASDQIRLAQYRLVKDSLHQRLEDVMSGVGDAVREFRSDAAEAALDVADLYDELLMSALDPADAEILRASARRTAERGYETALARATTSRVDLSQRVYTASVAVNEQVDRLIYAALATGKSAREIARSVSGLINPATPGGVSYAAMRLGRTELNNAFHAQQIAAMQRPWILGAKWNLSSSHPEPDDCDYYAGDEHIPGRGPGVFATGNVPAKPHPQCLCYLTPDTMDEEEFIKTVRRDILGVSEEMSGPVERSLSPAVQSHMERITHRVPAAQRAQVQDLIGRQSFNMGDDAILKLNSVSIEAMPKGHIAAYVEQTREMKISPAALANSAASERAFAKEVKSGFSTRKGSDVTALEHNIAHEMGHHLDNITFSTPNERRNFYQSLAGELGIKGPLFGDRRSLDKWVERNNALLGREVSRYGASDSAELLAEIWAEYTRGGGQRRAIIEKLGAQFEARARRAP